MKKAVLSLLSWCFFYIVPAQNLDGLIHEARMAMFTNDLEWELFMNQNKFTDDVNLAFGEMVSKSTIDSLNLLKPIYDRLVEQKDSIIKEAESLVRSYQDVENKVSAHFRKLVRDSLVIANDFINTDKYCKLLIECAGSDFDLETFIAYRSKVLYSPIKDPLRKKFAKRAHKKYGVQEYGILVGNGGNIFDETIYKLQNGITRDQLYDIESKVLEKVVEYVKSIYSPEVKRLEPLIAELKPIVNDLEQNVMSAQIAAILVGVSKTNTMNNLLNY